MKQKILDIIYSEFDRWQAKQSFVCRKGCAACCTQNVTITAVEGEQIFALLHDTEEKEWLTTRLALNRVTAGPKMTTNEFAQACMDGTDADQDDNTNLTPCPFLSDNVCAIYEARPFGCRGFASTSLCSAHQPATMPDHYLSAITAVTQLIEHLGQGEYWGNMLDVLTAMTDSTGQLSLSQTLTDQSHNVKAQFRLRKAQPLPGFLIPPEDYDQVAPLLNAIFQSRIGEKTVEQILNSQ